MTGQTASTCPRSLYQAACALAEMLGLTLCRWKAIDASGKSRYRIAKDLVIGEATLSQFMSGERGLTLTVLDRLADYLGLTLCGRASR